MTTLFRLTVLASLSLLGLSVWPGHLADLLSQFPCSCVSLPLLGVWPFLIYVLTLRELSRKPDPARPRRRWALLSGPIFLVTVALLWGDIPQRLVFIFCRSEFQRLADAVPADPVRWQEEVCRVGPYFINGARVDPRGGVFFRTHTGPEGIGPDQMSYGFAFRPSGEGTPFGNARYRQRRLFDDWYAFAVSND
jgi:hypothetical protein